MNHDPDHAVHDLLLSHAAKLTPHIQHGNLPEEVKDALESAQRTIRLTAELPVCYKTPANELDKAPEPETLVVTEADARAAVKTLKSEAKHWRALEAKDGPSMKQHANDMAREYEARANVLERKIPPRPWGLYAVLGLVSYALGVLSVVGAAAWSAP
jgi:hypothetical protein